MTIATITGPILDSAGKPVSGLLVVEGTAAFEGDGGAYVSKTPYVVQVANGIPTRIGAADWTQIVPPTGQAMVVVERLQPTGVGSAAGANAVPRTRALQLPADGGTVAYGTLQDVFPEDVGDWVIPAIVQELLEAAASLPGLVEDAEDAAAAAAASAASINKGVPNGVAGLDGGARVPQANLPAHLTPTALSDTFLTPASAASQMGLAESPLRQETELVIADALAGYSPTEVMVIVVAGTNQNTPRPAGYEGRICWVVSTAYIPTFFEAGDALFVGTAQTLVVASDDFNRTTLGNTPVGNLPWTVYRSAAPVATVGITSGQLHFLSGLGSGSSIRNVVIVNPGSVAYAAQLRVASMDSVFSNQVVLAFTDINNYVTLTRVSSSDGHWRVVEYVAGAASPLAVTTKAMVAGQTIRREINGSTLRAFVDGELVWSGTPTNIGAGFGAGISTASTDAATNCGWDDLLITQLAATP